MQSSTLPNTRRARKKIVFLSILAALVFTLALLVIFRQPLRAFSASQYRQVRAYLASGQVQRYNHAQYTNIVFLHHSVGRNFIKQAGMREALKAQGFDLWDQDYNYLHLTDPSGKDTGWSFEVPNNNTDPDGLAVLFSQPVSSQAVNAFSGLMQYEVIVFKSCFSASVINSDAQLESYKRNYLQIRAVIDQHPDKLFLLLTQPPLHPQETDPKAALRARHLADWLAAPEFSQGHPNLVVYNLFDQLAEPDPAAKDYGTLRKDYRRPAIDSHPNTSANQEITPRVTDFIVQSIKTFRAAQQARP